MSTCANNPLRRGPRVSSLPMVAKCPGLPVSRKHMGDEVGSAAHTGSAVGRVIELWHRFGEESGALEEALRQAQSPQEVEVGDYRLADWDTVRGWARFYAEDPRNQYGVVVADMQEAEVRYTLPVWLPSDEDAPTGEPVELVGHVDQIRRDRAGNLTVWDLKSGKAQGEEMVYAYALQLAAYSLAATETLGETVLPGGIIRLRGYDSKRPKECPPDGRRVFFETPWSLDACRALLDTVSATIEEVRRGVVRLQPGDHCRFCPAGGPGQCYRVVEEALEAADPDDLGGLL